MNIRITLFVVVLLTLSCVLAGAKIAQAQPTISPPPSLAEATMIEEIGDLTVGTTTARWNLRYSPNRSGPVTGMIRFSGAPSSDRREGYLLYTSKTVQSLALMQFKRNARNVEYIDRVFTADWSVPRRGWLGASHPFNAASGPAVAFLATGALSARCAADPACAMRTLPPTPSTTAPLAFDPANAAIFDLLAGVLPAATTRGQMVLRVAADGVFAGHVLGDTIEGHYASAAGTIAFVRRSNSVPIQIWIGVLDTVVGRSNGKGLPLTPAGGGRFGWIAQKYLQSPTRLESRNTTGRCLIAAGTSGPGTLISTQSCSSTSTWARWVLAELGPAIPTIPGVTFALVSTVNGLCLEMPTASGGQVLQQVCNGGYRQMFNIVETELTEQGRRQVNVVDTVAEFDGLALEAQFFFRRPGTTDCLAILGTGDTTTFGCTNNKSQWRKAR